MINIGDMVGRKSYNCDIIFEVIKIENDMAVIIGKTIRLIADAPLEDLEIVDDDRVVREDEKEEEVIDDISSQVIKKNRKRYITGKILHVDGDKKYMRKCLNLYNKVGVYAVGIDMEEKEMSSKIIKYIKHFQPDIVIITGHDSFNKKEIDDVRNYRNTQNFVEAVLEIRKCFPVLNKPIVIAGACQSHFEALIAAGANFASSPNRVNIQSLDPAIIAVKCCSTGINEIIRVKDAIDKTSNKNEGIGGISTFGTMKTLFF